MNISGEKKPEMITDKNGVQHHIKSMRDIEINNFKEMKFSFPDDYEFKIPEIHVCNFKLAYSYKAFNGKYMSYAIKCKKCKKVIRYNNCTYIDSKELMTKDDFIYNLNKKTLFLH